MLHFILILGHYFVVSPTADEAPLVRNLFGIAGRQTNRSRVIIVSERGCYFNESDIIVVNEIVIVLVDQNFNYPMKSATCIDNRTSATYKNLGAEIYSSTK